MEIVGVIYSQVGEFFAMIEVIMVKYQTLSELQKQTVPQEMPELRSYFQSGQLLCI